ncbi:MAG: DNA repair protein RecO [Granulicella sp. SCN 62-9]|nr:MAG: DNA repair protein RecO [Granulicella sp. SCN 62-9]
MIQRQGEAIVLRVWPFQEADLLVSLFTREQGRVKGVARHALRSRRRFGGALEPMTHVRATYTERPRQELVRLDAFEILSSPLSRPIDYARTAGLQLVAEVLEEALPEQAPEDAVFRLALSVLEQIQVGRVSVPITYFALWMNRLMGWMPELGHCVVCGLDLRGGTVWYSATSDGVTCPDDRRTESMALPAEAVTMAGQIFRGKIQELAKEQWQKGPLANLQRFALDTLERHLERRLASARTLSRIGRNSLPQRPRSEP